MKSAKTNLSKYPKKGLSYSQIEDSKEVSKGFKCEDCGHTEAMVTTMGLVVCGKCFRCHGFIL